MKAACRQRPAAHRDGNDAQDDGCVEQPPREVLAVVVRVAIEETVVHDDDAKDENDSLGAWHENRAG